MSELPEIDIATLEEVRAAGAPLIDVRNPDEFLAARVPGAQLMPMGELVERVDEIPVDESVYLICAVGARSARAVEFLRTKGIDAVNVAGGTKAWIESGRATASGRDLG